jgi:phosphohistidine phosphatase SixA
MRLPCTAGRGGSLWKEYYTVQFTLCNDGVEAVITRDALRTCGLFLGALVWQLAPAQPLQGTALVSALQHGGYVIVMRHASSPQQPPLAGRADSGNPRNERQLDAAGRSSAQAMGAAIRRLHIPIGEVLCSPTYRALETVRLARLGKPRIREELGDAGHSMQSDPTGARGGWLRMQVAAPPAPKTNTVLVTHLPNIREAFAADAAGLGDGAALVFHPDGHGGAQLVARVPIEEWPQLAAR